MPNARRGELEPDYKGLRGSHAKLVIIGGYLFFLVAVYLGVSQFLIVVPDHVKDIISLFLTLGLCAATEDLIATLRREKKQLLVSRGAYRLFSELLLESEENRAGLLAEYLKRSFEAFMKHGDGKTANRELRE